MRIRKAEENDIPRIMELLGQVLEIHADIRPDIFIPGMMYISRQKILAGMDFNFWRKLWFGHKNLP